MDYLHTVVTPGCLCAGYARRQSPQCGFVDHGAALTEMGFWKFLSQDNDVISIRFRVMTAETPDDIGHYTYVLPYIVTTNGKGFLSVITGLKTETFKPHGFFA
jgi:hypothetical protein